MRLPSPDARPAGAQQPPVLLGVDRGANPGQSSAQADSEIGGSGPWSIEPNLLRAVCDRRLSIGTARPTVAGLAAAGVLRNPFGAFAAGAAVLQPAVPPACRA